MKDLSLSHLELRIRRLVEKNIKVGSVKISCILSARNVLIKMNLLTFSMET